jgi:hypothetical protein
MLLLILENYDAEEGLQGLLFILTSVQMDQKVKKIQLGKHTHTHIPHTHTHTQHRQHDDVLS